MKKILIADDEQHVLIVLRQTLKRAGYAVDTVSNGEIALRHINTDPPDLLITDIQMPKMGGQSLCEKIRRDHAELNLHIIVMTARTDRELRHWAAKFSDISFFEKPLSPRRLVEEIAQVFCEDPA